MNYARNQLTLNPSNERLHKGVRYVFVSFTKIHSSLIFTWS